MIRADVRYDKDLIVKDLMNINIDEKEEVSQMEKKQALEALKKSGLVAVIRKPKSDQIDAIAKALVQGGVGALEITLETPGALAMIKHLKEKYADQVLVGAGTVLDAEGAEKAIAAGSDFIFSPNCDPDTIKTTIDRGKISIPGVMTPTEVVQAHKAGADIVKVFPASSLGPRYLKELQGPLGHVPMMPTGGVDLENVEEFIQNGAVAVGVGGFLVDKQAIQAGQYAILTEKAKQLSEKIKRSRAAV